MKVAVNMLAHSPIFAKTGEQTLWSLVHGADVITLSAKQHLFYMGEAANHFFLVKSGAVTLYRPSYTGDNKIFRTVEEGDLLVETAMFLDPPEYPLSAQAVSDVICYRLPRENLLQLCQQSPDFSLAMLGGMAMRISQSLNRIDLLTVGSAAQRVVLYLMDLYTQQRRSWIVLPASLAILSRQLNVAPETLSRQLSAFKREGFIGEKDAQQIVLLDVEGLCRSVGLPPPSFQKERIESSRHLGSSLFDCCNYAHQTLGRKPKTLEQP